MAAQDESLRLVAEVVDKFSGPLRNLRTMLQGVQAGPGVEKLKTGLEGSQKAASALSREVGNTLTPALNAAGIAGLSVSGALLGVGAALRAFTGSTATLALLGRETRMTVDSMRVLEEVGKRFDIAPEAMQQSFRNFAENAQQLKRGIGDITGFLQSQSPAVAKWAAELQRDLAKGLDPDVAYRRAVEFMRRIQDPIDRGRFAEKLFGNKQLGLFGSEDIGKVIDEVERQLGRLPKGAAENALAFKHSWDAIITSLIGVRDAVGITLLPTLKEMTDEFGKFVESPAVKTGVTDALNSVAKVLRETDWKSIGGDIMTVFGMIGSAASNTASGIRTLSDVLKSLKEWKPIEAFRKLDDGILSKVVPKNVVPSIWDLTRGKPDVETLEKRRDGVQNQIDGIDTGGKAGAASAEDAARREKLATELKQLTEEIRKLREATKPYDPFVQQQSFNGTGPFGGASVQNAGFGGFAAGGGYSALPPAMRPYQGGSSLPQSSPWGGSGRAGRSSRSPQLRAPQETGPWTAGGGRFPRIELPKGASQTRERLRGREDAGPGLNADGSINGMSRDATEEYANILGKRESGNRYGIRNSYGFSGRWQMGAAALADTGYVQKGTKNRGLSDDSVWTGKNGIGSLKEFLANKDGIQDRQFIEYTNRNRRALERLGVLKEGMTPAQQAGWLAAAHLKGPGGAAALARGNDNVDANGTAASSYFRMMARVGRETRKAAQAAEPTGGRAFDQTVKAYGSRPDETSAADGKSAFGAKLPKIDESDAMLRKALKSPLMGPTAVDLKGGATLDISFKNPPAGMSTSTSMDGLFKDLNLRKGASLPKAGVDI
jgi:hypothetical protein